MELIHTVADLRQALQGHTDTAFVPTMGNLHDGHLALVRTARGHGGPVVASIFVNRLQFLPHEDFDRYPRTLAQDCDALRGAGCDIVFAPSETELYPQPQAYKVHPDPALGDVLEGQFRPGFFTGVCTVVLKLFNLVQPRVAVFGKKDYQQWLVIRRMVEQLALPITVVGGDTRRAEDGLALSSRNAYLDADQRARSTALWRALQALAAEVRALRTSTDLTAVEARACEALAVQGWQPDYLTARRRSDLLPPSDADLQAGAPLVALAAARLGSTRLIDNLEF